MPELSKQEHAAIARIETLDDPKRLRTLIENARKQGSTAVERAAFERLCEVQPAAAPGTVEHDVWRSIAALEELLRDERGKTVLLSRTRQKIAKDGEIKTVADLALKSQPSEGFNMLIERGHPELLFEQIVLRHPNVFDDSVQKAAEARLRDAGVHPGDTTGGPGNG